MNNVTNIFFFVSLGAAVVVPTIAAPIDSLVDEIKRSVLINDPADKALESFTTHS